MDQWLWVLFCRSIGKRTSAALLSPTKVLSTDTSDSLRQFVTSHINNRWTKENGECTACLPVFYHIVIDYSGVVSVVFDFLKHLAVHFDWVWWGYVSDVLVVLFGPHPRPFPLGGVFVELYQKVEQHLAQPSPLWWVFYMVHSGERCFCFVMSVISWSQMSWSIWKNLLE